MAIKQPLVSQSSRAHGAPTDDPIRAGRSRCRSRTGHAGRTTGGKPTRPAAQRHLQLQRLKEQGVPGGGGECREEDGVIRDREKQGVNESAPRHAPDPQMMCTQPAPTRVPLNPIHTHPIKLHLTTRPKILVCPRSASRASHLVPKATDAPCTT
jgi:hypothetical protein